MIKIVPDTDQYDPVYEHESHRYQHLFYERLTDVFTLHNIPNSKGLYAYAERPEELACLIDELGDEVWKFAQTVLTDQQFKILSLTLDGYSQTEVANLLGIRRADVSTSINGRLRTAKQKILYKYQCGPKHGEVMRRMIKSIKTGTNSQEVLDYLLSDDDTVITKVVNSKRSMGIIQKLKEEVVFNKKIQDILRQIADYDG
jgi:transcriptional regulator